MFTKTVDSVISSLTKVVNELTTIVDTKNKEYVEARNKADLALSECDRAERIRAKLNGILE